MKILAKILEFRLILREKVSVRVGKSSKFWNLGSFLREKVSLRVGNRKNLVSERVDFQISARGHTRHLPNLVPPGSTTQRPNDGVATEIKKV